MVFPSLLLSSCEPFDPLLGGIVLCCCRRCRFIIRNTRIESKLIHIALTVTPIPMPALAPVLSPELELRVDDGVGVEGTLLDVRLDCVVEEDDVIYGADVDLDVDVDVEVDAKSTSSSSAGA